MASRITQDILEVAVATTNQKARITEDVLEVAVATTNQKARITEECLEVMIANWRVGPREICRTQIIG